VAAPFYEAIDPVASGDASGSTLFVPPAVVEDAERTARRRPAATEDESAADVVAAPTVDHEESSDVRSRSKTGSRPKTRGTAGVADPLLNHEGR
jgi:hypothetical protein